MKKDKKYLMIFLLALIAFVATIDSTLAGTFTVTRPADGTYSNNGTIVIAITYTNGSAPTGLINATNMTIYNNANGSMEKNGTYSTTGNHGLNGTLVNFSVKITADRTMSWYVNMTNSSGSLIEGSSVYTYYYDTTALTLSIDTPIFDPSSKITTATYYPADAVAISNCTMPGGSIVDVTAGGTFTDTTTETAVGDKTYTITCLDRAGNSVSTSSTYNIAWGSSTTTYEPPSAGEIAATPSAALPEGVKKPFNPVTYIIVGGLIVGVLIIGGLVYMGLKGSKKRRKR